MAPARELEGLYDEHAQAIYAFLLNLTRNEADTRDLLQEVFVKLARQPGLILEMHHPRAFLLRLSHNAGIAAGQTQTFHYQATLTPSGWLSERTSQPVAFPRVVVDGTTSLRGTLAVQTLDDLTVRVDQDSGLTPLLDNEKASFGLADLPTYLAYQFDTPDYAAGLVVERTIPSVAARLFSFLRIEPDYVAAHYDLHYELREARTRRVVFSLPGSTPAELTIRGLASTTVKEFNSRSRSAPTLHQLEGFRRAVLKTSSEGSGMNINTRPFCLTASS